MDITGSGSTGSERLRPQHVRIESAAANNTGPNIVVQRLATWTDSGWADCPNCNSFRGILALFMQAAKEDGENEQGQKSS